jgi:sugar phosphate isomerase/epimerase
VKVSISEITTVSASFEQDLAAYRAAGAGGIGLWEFKLGDDSAARSLLRESGLAATHCVPAVPSILPLPLMPEGPAEPEGRVEALCASVRRLAAFEPVCVLFLTGPGDDRAAVAEGIRAIADEGARSGVRVALEPIQPEFADYWTVVSSLAETAALLDEAERPDVAIMFDTWHLWNTEGVPGEIGLYADRIAGVHVADWRDPTRNTNDRAFPGEGVAPLGEILGALERAGYEGWYDVEIFSDADLEGSLWTLPPEEAARRAVAALERVWNERAP